MLLKFKDLQFDHYGNIESPTLVLKALGGRKLGVLGRYMNLELTLRYNDVSEATFEYPYKCDGEELPFYNDLTGRKVIEIEPFGEFILMNPEVNDDGIRKVKRCQCYSLEYEINNKNIYIPTGTYNFFNPTNPGDTIIGIIKELLPNWGIGDIDTKLLGRYRTFDSLGSNLYDFMMNTLQATFDCLFLFDTKNKLIHVRCNDKPILNSPIYLSFDNLIKNATVTELTDDMATVLEAYGADPVTIRSANPTGTNKIYNLDYYIKNGDIPVDIAHKWNLWKQTFDSSQAIYASLCTQYNIQLSVVLAEKAKLTLMEKELSILETLKSASIEEASSSDLAQANKDIEAKKKEIEDQKAVIKTESDILDATLEQKKEINKNCSFDSFFTKDEIIFLNWYFKETTLQDNTYVASDVNYNVSDLPSTIKNGEFAISDAKVVEISVDPLLNKRLFDFRGGKLSLSQIEYSLVGDIVNITLECNKTSNEFVLSCFINSVNNNSDSYPSANLTMKGTLSNLNAGDETLSFKVATATTFLQFGVTEYQRQTVEKELYDYAVDSLKKISTPLYEFSIESANFLFSQVFAPFKDTLELGNSVNLELDDDEVIYPALLEVNINFEHPDNYSMVFSDKFQRSVGVLGLADSLSNAISTAKSVDFSKHQYSKYANSGADTAVKKYMESMLDVAKNAIIGGDDQAIEWNNSGFNLRKWNESKTDYLPEQIRMINNMIGFTDDGWETAKIAIGKFVDKNLGDMYGICAPAISGTLLAGENLVIENMSPDGQRMQFKVDASGAYLNNSQFLIQSDLGGQVALDPVIGFALGGSISKPLYDVLDTGALRLNKENANLYTDLLHGDLYLNNVYATNGDFTGKITATSGLFKGTIQANKYLDASGNDMFLNGKFQSKYLDLGNIQLDGSTGDITMTGNINLSNGNINWGNNAPVQYQFSTNGTSNWHTTMTNSDKYRRDSLDGGKTWSASYQFRGTDGRNGADGSDANVPEYIKSTYIDGTSVSSPVLRGGTVTGARLVLTDEIATGTSDLSELAVYDRRGNKYGYIRYDSGGAGTTQEARERMYVCTETGKALKIQSGADMSISAPGGKIYMDNVVFTNNPEGVYARFK